MSADSDPDPLAGLDGVETDGGQATPSPLETLEASSDSEVSRRDSLRRLYRQFVVAPAAVLWDDWRARVGGFIVLSYVLVGLFGPMIVQETYTNEGPRLLQPFDPQYLIPLVDTPDVTLNLGVWEFTFTGLFVWKFPLGTDNVGGDLFARTIYSTRPVLKMILAGGLFTVGVGTVVGLLSGYKGGVVDDVLSTVTDIFLNIPGLPLVIVLAGIFTPSNPYLVGMLLAVAAWAGLARSIRSQVLTLRNESFTEASRTMGLSTSRIVTLDILPHLMPYVTVNLVNAARNIIFSAVGLYFIGVLPFDNPNWGVTLSLAYNNSAMYMLSRLHWLLVPIVAIVGLSMGLILLAQSLDRVFNPRVRAKHSDAAESSDDDEDEQVYASLTP